MIEVPEATVFATVYEVCCIPPGWATRRHFMVTVEFRGKDTWAVLADGCCYDVDGFRGHESSITDRTPDFLRRHRFTLDDALALAKRIAPTLTVGGHTVADALANGPRWS